MIHVRRRVSTDEWTRVAVFSTWDAESAWRRPAGGPVRPITIEKGEHLLLLGHDIVSYVEHNYTLDRLEKVDRAYLKFLRLSTQKYVWIASFDILHVLMFENARRGIMRYLKRYNLSTTKENR